MLLKIISLLKEILAVLIDIRTGLSRPNMEHIQSKDELMDNSDAKRLLKICGKTLYRWRKEKRIRSIMIGNKHYYSKTELIHMKENDGQKRTF